MRAKTTDIYQAIEREIGYAEREYAADRDTMGLGDWLIVIKGELREAEDALARGNWTHARAELTQVAAATVNALRYLGVVERCTVCCGSGYVGCGPGDRCTRCDGGYNGAVGRV